MGEKLNRKRLILINVVLGQAVVTGINGMWGYYGSNLHIDIPIQYVTRFSIVASFILGFAAIFLIREINDLVEKEAEAKANAVRLKESLEFIDILRAQRHDFINHIQVVYGLAQMGQIKSLSSYVSELNEVIELEARLHSLAQPALAAFLIKKINFVSSQGGKFDLEVRTNLAHLEMSPAEAVRAVGNLIDNAIFAAGDGGEKEFRLLLNISEVPGYYKISVCNSGKKIGPGIIDKIFEKGFTTKGNRGSGLGLHIAKSLVESNGGAIRLVNHPEYTTCFEIILPKKPV